MSHAFCRTAQGRLPKPMSSKGKTTFSSKKEAQTASFFLIRNCARSLFNEVYLFFVQL